MPKHHDTRDDTQLTARTVVARLGIALSTLNMWLAADEERPLAERRFQFHVFHGRKRLWSEAGFQALKRAIETESQPGGCLGAWRDGSGSGGAPQSAVAAATAEAALREVLQFRLGGGAPARDRRAASASAQKTGQSRRLAKAGAA